MYNLSNRTDFTFYNFLHSIIKDIPVNSSIGSSEIYSLLRANGYKDKPSITVSKTLRYLGFRPSDHGGHNTYWYRVDFPELDERITKETKKTEKTEAPTLQERLAAQIESGERKAPAGYSEWRAEQEKKERAEAEMKKAIGWTASTDLDVVTTEKPYEFEEVETTVKLVGKFGTYKVVSNGQTVVDLLVSGTLSDEELRTLSRELDAVYCRARGMKE